MSFPAQERLQPSEILFIADAMIARTPCALRESFTSASAHRRDSHKLDGDARAVLRSPSAKSAALRSNSLASAKNMTRSKALSERMCLAFSHGDILSLIGRAEQAVDKKTAIELSVNFANPNLHWKIFATSFARFAKWVRSIKSWTCSPKWVTPESAEGCQGG